MPNPNEENKSVEIVPQASQSIIDAAKRESHQWLNPEVWRTMQIVAQTFLQSGAMPKSMDTAPKLIVALQAGREAGLQPLEAINSFYFVNGKVSLYGDMAISQVLKAGHKIEWGKCDDKTATVKITRGDNGASNEVTFTMQMAIERGLTSNGVYKKYPENMLRFKAFHSCAKFIVPDALHGVPIKEVEEAEAIEEIKPNKPGKVVAAAKAEKPIETNEDAILQQAITAKPEEKPKEEEKPMLQKVLDTFGGEVVGEGNKAPEQEIAENKKEIKSAAPKSGIDQLRETAQKIKDKKK